MTKDKVSWFFLFQIDLNVEFSCSEYFSCHFDAYDEFYTNVEVDPMTLTDEEGIDWSE